jgi:Porphyranase catalytic subdomain 1
MFRCRKIADENMTTRSPIFHRPSFCQFLLSSLLVGSLSALHAQGQGNPANIASSAPQAGGGKVQEVSIVIEPTCTRRIEGTSDLNRSTYFNLFTNIDKTSCKTPEVYDWLVKENRIVWGSIQGVMTAEYGGFKYTEDPKRPGFVDQESLKKRLAAIAYQPTEDYRHDMGNRIELVSHDHTNAHPSFMGETMSKAAAKEDKKHQRHSLPTNLEAAAELYALSLLHGFSDFNRPQWLELLNEPHWSYWSDPHLANYHTVTRDAVHRMVPGVRVGGPCLPVAYYYGRQYDNFRGLRDFIDNTKCGLDFYSFHVYDFLDDTEKPDDFAGRITSGLPLESVLDLIQNHTVNHYGKKVDIVISETGGYGAKKRIEAEARKRIPGEGFEWEMKKRSIDDFNMVSSLIGHTLTYMDHPEAVKKSVPFILLDAMAWDPTYYSTLYVPRNFQDKNDWVATKKIHFYQMFRDLQGRRVTASCPDPDVQTRAFVDGNSVFVVMNNLSNQPKNVRLEMPAPAWMMVRRFGRHADLTPYLTEEVVTPVKSLALKPREAVLLRAEFIKPVVQERVVNEISCYGDKVATKVKDKTAITVKVPHLDQVDHAWLRVGISRPQEGAPEVDIVLNGKPLVVPLEQCADRLTEKGKDYASCKLVRLDPAALQEVNTITVSFPDGKPGAVGAVVIRAAYQAP